MQKSQQFRVVQRSQRSECVRSLNSFGCARNHALQDYKTEKQPVRWETTALHAQQAVKPSKGMAFASANFQPLDKSSSWLRKPQCASSRVLSIATAFWQAADTRARRVEVRKGASRLNTLRNLSVLSQFVSNLTATPHQAQPAGSTVTAPTTLAPDVASPCLDCRAGEERCG